MIREDTRTNFVPRAVNSAAIHQRRARRMAEAIVEVQQGELTIVLAAARRMSTFRGGLRPGCARRLLNVPGLTEFAGPVALPVVRRVENLTRHLAGDRVRVVVLQDAGLWEGVIPGGRRVRRLVGVGPA